MCLLLSKVKIMIGAEGGKDHRIIGGGKISEVSWDSNDL